VSVRLRDFVDDPSRIKQGSPIAVVAGAGHVPALYLTLRECGFEDGTVRWFEVLDGRSTWSLAQVEPLGCAGVVAE
jgi:hypothetical protein